MKGESGHDVWLDLVILNRSRQPDASRWILGSRTERASTSSNEGDHPHRLRLWKKAPSPGAYAEWMNPTQPGSALSQLCKPHGMDRDIPKHSEVEPTVADLQSETIIEIRRKNDSLQVGAARGAAVDAKFARIIAAWPTCRSDPQGHARVDWRLECPRRQRRCRVSRRWAASFTLHAATGRGCLLPQSLRTSASPSKPGGMRSAPGITFLFV